MFKDSDWIRNEFYIFKNPILDILVKFFSVFGADHVHGSHLDFRDFLELNENNFNDNDQQTSVH